MVTLGQNYDVNRYLLSLWPTGASYITKSTIVPENPLFSLFSLQKHIKGPILILPQPESYDRPLSPMLHTIPWPFAHRFRRRLKDLTYI